MRRKFWWLRHGGIGLAAVLATGVAVGASPNGGAVIALQSGSGGESTGLFDYVSFVPMATALLIALAVRRYLRSREGVPTWLERGWYSERIGALATGFVGRLPSVPIGGGRESNRSKNGVSGETTSSETQRQGSGSASTSGQTTGAGTQQSTTRATARSSSNTPVRTASNTPVRTTSNTPVSSTGTGTPVPTASDGNTPVQTTSSTPVQTASSSTPVQTAGSTPVQTSSSTPVSPSSSTPVRPTSSTPIRTTNPPTHRGHGSDSVPDRLALVYGEQRILVADGDTVDEKIRAILRWADEDDHTRWIDDGHLRFVRDEHGFTLVAGGENLTRLNGDRVPAGERARIFPGDVIELSGVVALDVRRP